MEVLLRQEDGTYAVVPIKVEIHGTGIVVNPTTEEDTNG